MFSKHFLSATFQMGLTTAAAVLVLWIIAGCSRELPPSEVGDCQSIGSSLFYLLKTQQTQRIQNDDDR